MASCIEEVRLRKVFIATFISFYVLVCLDWILLEAYLVWDCSFHFISCFFASSECCLKRIQSVIAAFIHFMCLCLEWILLKAYVVWASAFTSFPVFVCLDWKYWLKRIQSVIAAFTSCHVYVSWLNTAWSVFSLWLQLSFHFICLCLTWIVLEAYSVWIEWVCVLEVACSQV